MVAICVLRTALVRVHHMVALNVFRDVIGCTISDGRDHARQHIVHTYIIQRIGLVWCRWCRCACGSACMASVCMWFSVHGFSVHGFSVHGGDVTGGTLEGSVPNACERTGSGLRHLQKESHSRYICWQDQMDPW